MARSCMKPLTREWVKKAENDCKVAALVLRRRKDIVPDAAGFFCQQSVGKYLKARLIESGISFPRVHDLLVLLNLCVQVKPLWSACAQVVDDLPDFAVDFRYSGRSARPGRLLRAAAHCARKQDKAWD